MLRCNCSSVRHGPLVSVYQIQEREKVPHGTQVVEPMEETRSQIVFVTEPVYASIADYLGRFASLPTAVALSREGIRLSQLEISVGLLQV